MLTKTQLLGINDLNIYEILDQLDDDDFRKYCAELEQFVSTLQALEESLKKLLNLKEYDNFRSHLQELANKLTQIHADKLVQSCIKLISEVESSKYEAIEANFTYLLTKISALSIDVQVALYKSETEVLAEKHPITNDDNRTKIILAVDDVPLNLNGLKLILKDMQEYKLTCVTSGETTLKYLNNNTPDLFILDIEMPEMNGYELAGKIRERGFDAPIIFLTGNATADYVKKAMQSGGADFIVKPVDKDAVIAKIKKYAN